MIKRTYIFALAIIVTAYCASFVWAADNNVGTLDIPSEGISKMLTLAEHGNKDAQLMLATLYIDKGNYVEAAKWLHKGAEQGDAHSEYMLGKLYNDGVGVPKSEIESVKWYRKAADHGNAAAQGIVGAAYHDGIGVEQNYKEAIKWYRKAADQGNAPAQANLAQAYNRGEGVLLNYTEAVKWFRKAAEQGNIYAQLNLGLAYGIGNGVPKDHVLAYMWFNLAAVQNDQNAIDGRTVAEKYMTQNQIAEAQRLSREWVQGHAKAPHTILPDN